MKSIDRLMVILISVLVFSVTPVYANEAIPVSEEASPVAENFVHFMSQGEPADSLMLRVSFGFEGNIRGEGHSFIIVEELRWPVPIPRMHIETITDDSANLEIETEEWWGGAVLIDGAYLNKERRKLPQPETPGQRPGELCGHCLWPFMSVEWVSPREFIVESKRALFSIRYKEPGVYELTKVVRTG